MHDSIVLLITRDPELARSVEEVAGSVRHLRLVTVPTLEDAAGALGRPDLALVLAHLAGDGDADRIAGLLRDMAVVRRPVATVVLGVRHDAEEALRLLRLGAGDYL